MSKKTVPPPEPSFEERLMRLEDIVRLLDQGDTPLDQMLALYEEGLVLAKECSAVLNQAEQKITMLQNDVSA